MADCRSIQLDAATSNSPSTASNSRQSSHNLLWWLGAIDVDRGRNTNSYSTIDLSSFLNYMSEERLERIENQLSQVIQAVGVMQQNMMAMQNRMDSMEGTLLTTMTDGFNSLQNYIIDLDTDLAQNERKTEDNARNNRRLNQRLMRLENRNDDF
jgi:hypothetical protein